MKGPFCVIVIGMFFVTTNGQCPFNVGNSSVVPSCEGIVKHGSAVFVDFYKISRPCTCIVTPSFDGSLLVVSREAVEYDCNTEVIVQNTSIFGCPTNIVSSLVLNVKINQTVDVRARYVSSSTSGMFQHCMGFRQNGGIGGILSVMCGSSSETTVKTTTTLSSTPIITSPIESTSVAVNNKNTDATRSSNMVNSSFDSLLVESTQENPEMIYIIAGSVAGGTIILVGLVLILIVMKMKRSRSADNKERSLEGDIVHKNEIFVSNSELPDNPLYLFSQPMDELGYSSDQEKQLGLPPTYSKTKKIINSNYDVPPNNKPLDHGASSLPVYAVSKRNKDRTSEVSTGDVYAEVCKPNRCTEQFPVRKYNEDGLLYMEVEQNPGATKQKPMSEIK